MAAGYLLACSFLADFPFESDGSAKGASVMRKTSRLAFQKAVAACLFSWLIASAICASTSPAVTGGARVIADSVNRTNKADRLILAQRAAHVSVPAKNTISSTRTPVGCEAAFSPFANPGRADVLNYCVT